jgi:hypothetical protein
VSVLCSLLSSILSIWTLPRHSSLFHIVYCVSYTVLHCNCFITWSLSAAILKKIFPVPVFKSYLLCIFIHLAFRM